MLVWVVFCRTKQKLPILLPVDDVRALLLGSERVGSDPTTERLVFRVIPPTDNTTMGPEAA